MLKFLTMAQNCFWNQWESLPLIFRFLQSYRWRHTVYWWRYSLKWCQAVVGSDAFLSTADTTTWWQHIVSGLGGLSTIESVWVMQIHPQSFFHKINRFYSKFSKYRLYICFKCVIIVNASVKLKLTKINIIFKWLT